MSNGAERSEREQAKLLRKADIWSFQRAAKPAVPPLRASNPIDAFVEERRAKEGLTASPPADRRTMARRLYFNLTGLPPAPGELSAYLSDTSPDAYGRLVDRLLGSQRYGERWARYWLDIVHFGESHGYDKDKPRPNAWPYRDYVIQAANEDMPWWRFVQEQIAGDILFPNDPRATIATGFVAAGPWDFVGHVELPESKTDGLIARYNDRDDMVMTTMTSFLSLTVHCARCHDHKFDAITQEDYYRLQAVFAGVDRADRVVDTHPEKRRELLAERAQLEKFLDMPEGRRLSTLGYHSAIEKKNDVTKWVQLDFSERRKIEAIGLVPAFESYGAHPGPAFGFPVSFRIDVSDDPEFKTFQTIREENEFPTPGNFPVVTAADCEVRHVRITATKLWKRTDDWIFALGEAWVVSGGSNIAAQAAIRAADSIEAPSAWAKTNLVDGIAVVPYATDWKKWITHSKERIRLARISTELKGLEGQMVYAAAADFKPSGNFKPAGKPRPVHLLKRGDVKQPEREMEPGALEFFPDLPFKFASCETEGQRRAQLAKWLTQKENMLLRRSIVNRVWQFHFGRGLVDSPNDFGHMGSEPTHPELLDWLAFWFVENGESIKALHKLILTSATYQQSSVENPEYAKKDSDNRFLWRMNRTRLEAEAVRDAMLSVSGQLDLRMGGPSDQQFFFKDDHSPIYDYTRFDVDSPNARRRSIYRFIVRSVPDPLMDTLDCPDPSLLAGKRNVTVTALQALATLNNPFVLKQAEHFASRLNNDASRIGEAFELALSRRPTDAEHEALAGYARAHGLANVCRVIFNMSEFMFID